MTDFATADSELIPGYLAWQAKRYDEALAVFESVLAHRGDVADAWRGVGSVRWSQHRYDLAHIAFVAAVGANPASAMHWANLGLVLRDLGRRDEALARFEVALTLDRCYHPAWNERSNVLYDAGRFHEAVVGYRRALQLTTDEAVYFHNLGECLLAMRDQRGAISQFRAALAVDPDYGFSAQRLAELVR